MEEVLLRQRKGVSSSFALGMPGLRVRSIWFGGSMCLTGPAAGQRRPVAKRVLVFEIWAGRALEQDRPGFVDEAQGHGSNAVEVGANYPHYISWYTRNMLLHTRQAKHSTQRFVLGHWEGASRAPCLQCRNTWHFPCQLAEIDTILGTLESQSISSVDAVLGNFGTKKIASGNRAKIS